MISAETLRHFFLWCFIINYGILVWWWMLFYVCPGQLFPNPLLTKSLPVSYNR